MPIYSEGRVLPAQSRGDRSIKNASTAHCTGLGRVEVDEWQADLLSWIQLADLDAFSDDENLSELVSKNEETRFWIQAVIDKRTKLCLGLHTCPKEITPETLLAWKGDRQ